MSPAGLLSGALGFAVAELFPEPELELEPQPATAVAATTRTAAA
jgi:hypothetical protein